MEQKPKKWYKKWWVITLFVILFLGFIGSITEDSETTMAEEDYLEVSTDELYSIFSGYSGLSDIQRENKYENEFKDKLIKTSIRADRVDKASLSTQYVVLQLITPLSCEVKAFFPSEEKDKLLSANIGDTIVFVGKLGNHDFGFASCLEFSESKVLEIKNE